MSAASFPEDEEKQQASGVAQASPGDGGFAESGSLVELKHELSSPLMVIRWNLEVARGILQEDEAAGEDARARALDAIDAALQGMEHASRMVRAWRGARGSREAPARLDLGAVVTATVRMTRAWLEERAVVEVQVASDPLVVEGTETRLRQVLLNLFDNAYHALAGGDPAQHRVTIVARAQDEQVIVEVNDSGAGIEPDLVRQLGEPFVSARPGGTGLGLNLCSEIVWEHGGRLEIESQVGSGTSVRVCLPRVLPGSVPPVPSPERETPTVKPPRVGPGPQPPR